MAEIADEFAVEGSRVYDLGCSTGHTLKSLAQGMRKDVQFIGVDYSAEMLKKCKSNISDVFSNRKLKLLRRDLNDGIDIKKASVVVLNLTLQFVRPLSRDLLIQNILSGLNYHGCLILVEKVLGNDSLFDRMFIKFYYEMKKRNGYTQMEIAQKREALENILIPYRVNENIQLLKKNGFSNIDVFFKWYNFSGILGVKS